jgi:hypothetical protein
MTHTEIWLGEHEYTRIDIRRQFKPSIVIYQDAKGYLTIEFGEHRERIYDERVIDRMSQNGNSSQKEEE